MKARPLQKNQLRLNFKFMVDIKDRELHRISLTAIIYNSDGKYLITKRALNKKAFPGKWTVPGGGLEVDDYISTKPTNSAGQWYGALENTIRREVREEVNLEIEKPEYLLDIAFIRPDGIPVIILSYYAKYKSGEVKLDADSIDYKWVTLKEAKSYDIIDGIWEEIEMVDKILRK
jgi:8-oxo-dGTP pyrophosphatase MutT (NUDIX family)